MNKYYLDRSVFILAAILLCGCSREPEDWKSAAQEDTIGAYELYIKEHRTGAHCDDAIKRLDSLKDDEAWAGAVTFGSISGFSRYIEERPSGRYVKEAKSRIEEARWLEALALNSVSAFESFIVGSPSSDRVNEARKCIDYITHFEKYKTAAAAGNWQEAVHALQFSLSIKSDQTLEKQLLEAQEKLEQEEEKVAWEDVETKDIVEAYRSFHTRFPNSDRVIETTFAFAATPAMVVLPTEEFSKKTGRQLLMLGHNKKGGVGVRISLDADQKRAVKAIGIYEALDYGLLKAPQRARIDSSGMLIGLLDIDGVILPGVMMKSGGGGPDGYSFESEFEMLPVPVSPAIPMVGTEMLLVTHIRNSQPKGTVILVSEGDYYVVKHLKILEAK